ncbi:hypothetical protein A1Q1_01552 [Trichosporon asahii var. asahii CBS 2479]|uniref:Asl1-like glycosyl hydrolase catalytic domain-containing protein n=1 Tax=Trichosporon asahii var. asahii (strain ATCC 90039 / CBS 2479 / JCM 2466 / KCTC 7840 / NBRC 103889/ NCYC 2677 / UAMH 7654) TaxID=1186058 RepID=J4UDU1_TRIAS|nr:hypothetical protein A1Q1_01552 [Trichosporon asahii var. asahii CBS 2479]EJT49350.1 hypothetical protein A1Q1_01552 [Trichosporon asahii var. asahii CBS 2479]
MKLPSLTAVALLAAMATAKPIHKTKTSGHKAKTSDLSYDGGDSPDDSGEHSSGGGDPPNGGGDPTNGGGDPTNGGGGPPKAGGDPPKAGGNSVKGGGKGLPTTKGLEGITYVPQILEDLQQPGLLMRYNEPDGAGQANLAPADGAGAWPEFMSKCQNGGNCGASTDIISPAMAWDNQWLVDYYAKLCPGVSPQELHSSDCPHKPKYMAMHSYKPTFEGFKQEVETFAKNWPGFPIIISEFSCWNFGEGEKRCHEDINDYYAAFGAGIPRGSNAGGIEGDNAIVFADGEITELGKIYQSYGRA